MYLPISDGDWRSPGSLEEQVLLTDEYLSSPIKVSF